MEALSGGMAQGSGQEQGARIPRTAILSEGELAKQQEPISRGTGLRARKFLDELLHIIHSFDLRPIGFAFNVADFHSLTIGDRRLLTGATRLTRTQVRRGQIKVTDTLATSGAPTEPYFLGFDYAIAEAIKAVARGATVNFVFDDRDESGKNRARENVEEILRYSKRPEFWGRIGLISFGDSCKHEPLQAADLYAYAWNRALHGTMTEPLAHALSQLTKKRSAMGVANADFYRLLLTDLDMTRAAGIMKFLGVEDV